MRFGSGNVPEFIVLVAIGFIGLSLSAAWVVIIQSYKQLNSNKFRVLHDLETRLPFAFFTDEWDPLGTGSKSNRYWKLTHVENALPGIYAALFLGVIVYAIIFECCSM